MSNPHLSPKQFTASRDLAAGTRKTYEYHVTQFMDWLEGQGIGVLAVTPALVLQYMDMMRAQYKVSTCDLIHRSLRYYYEWLVEQGHMSQSPLANLRPDSVQRNVPRVVPVEDLRKMLDIASNDRHWVLIALLAVNSLRISDLLDCDVEDLDTTGQDTVLHVKGLQTTRRLNDVTIPDGVAEVLVRSLEGRTHGPLILGHHGRRMNRSSALLIVSNTAKKAGLPYKVNAQMLSYMLHGQSLQRGFSFRSVVRAAGIPEPSHSGRWVGPITPSAEDNASVRLWRVVANEPDKADTYLAHIEALLYESELPDAFIVMTAGAVLEKHLYELCLEHNIKVDPERKNGRINQYVGKLKTANVFTLGDLKLVEGVGEDRNNAAHGAFDLLPPNSGPRVLSNVRELIRRHPLP